MTEEAVMKRLTAEEIAELRSLVEVASFRIDHYGADDVRAEQALVDNRHALLAMASRLVELEPHDAPLDVPFGCDPEDSAALEKLRMAIDDADVWPSEAAKEAGDYEASVAHMADRASRLVDVESHIEHGRKLLLEIGGDSEECWQQNDKTFENAAPLADALARMVGYPQRDEDGRCYYPTQRPNDGGRDGQKT